MELIGITLRANYYKLDDIDECKIDALPIQTFRDSFFVRIQLIKGWTPGRSFRLAEKNKSFLVWNNQNAKLRIIHDGSMISVQRIQKNHPFHR